MNNFCKKGFSILEVLVVCAVVGILASIVIPQFAKTREEQVLKSAVEDTLSALDKARSETLSSLNSSEYGVHFQSDQVIIFKGTSFSAGDSGNESISLTSPASITNIALTGTAGNSNIYFKRLSGSPSANGTVTISTTNFSKVITISATGIGSSN